MSGVSIVESSAHHAASEGGTWRLVIYTMHQMNNKTHWTRHVISSYITPNSAFTFCLWFSCLL